ncbi:MAG: FAD-dependent monooxygenase [SAR86 cluster bacterium]|nr:FAD-dependent monooxygenase [SAR86 cluster bacterium]
MLSNVAVIGAGVSGLTAAYALKKIGIEVDVFERSESIKEFGAGITLSKNATILLEDIGLMDSLSSKGCHPMGSYIRDYKKAKVIKSKRLDKNFITLDRRDLVATLATRLEDIGVSIHFESEIKSIDPTAGEISISNHEKKSYDLILICDGIKSSLRGSYFDNQQPQFTNYVAWRGMTTIENLPKYEGSDKVNVYYGPGGHCVHYPTGRDNLINFIAIEHNKIWSEESWKTEGSKSEFLNCFEGWNEDLLSMFSSAQEVYKWGIFERSLPKTLYRDKCVLLGDAAHPMVPFLGQGGCLAIEDAYCLMSLLMEEKDINVVLGQYDKLRNRRGSWIQKRSKFQGIFNHVSNPSLAMIRNFITKLIMNNSVNRLHSYDLIKEISKLKTL